MCGWVDVSRVEWEGEKARETGRDPEAVCGCVCICVFYIHKCSNMQLKWVINDLGGNSVK